MTKTTENSELPERKIGIGSQVNAGTTPLNDLPPSGANSAITFSAAAGCPLLTEFVDELTEGFEEDVEMCFFRNNDELLSKADKMANDPLLQVMGNKAKQRVLKEHTLYHRATLFNKYLKSL